MKQVFIPDNLSAFELKRVEKELLGLEIKHPECKDDYVLVDILEDDINIKIFNGKLVDKILKKEKVSLRDFLMMIMRDQNRPRDKQIFIPFMRRQIYGKKKKN